MTEQLSFFVAGRPITQAGMREVEVNGFKRLITTGGEGLAPWRKKVTDVATLAIAMQHWEKPLGPVVVSYRFLLAMPKSRPAWQRTQGIAQSIVKPDLDKLARAVGDSLTDAGAYRDDSQVAEIHAAKYEVVDGWLEGVEVVVRELDISNVTSTMEALLARRRAAPRQSF